MTIYVFTGPTLSAEEGRAELDAIYLPPAAQGDVYRATLDRPWAIGIIDGYFERVPAVWHKEVLWALSQGIHVFGSASMGALRAAELEPYGMEGVGAIFTAFHDGQLEDDDEVAVAHGDAESGYRMTSEAMVNIRHTLEAAVQSGVITGATSAAMLRVGKDLFYPERSYPLLLSRSRELGLPAHEIDAFHAFLPTGQVNQKRADALAMLRLMRERMTTSPEAKHVRFSFEYTDAWDQVWRSASRQPLGTQADADTISPELLLEELQLHEGALERARQGAMIRALALSEARQRGLVVHDQLLEQTGEAFRRERGLWQRQQIEDWLRDNRLGIDPFARFLQHEAQVRWIQTMFESDVLRHVPDQLRASGEYRATVERAEDKRHMLSLRGLENPALADAGLTEEALWHWFFEERLGRPVPFDLSLFLRTAGLTNQDALRRAALREWLYLRIKG